jgi:hypothetical protein
MLTMLLAAAAPSVTGIAAGVRGGLIEDRCTAADVEMYCFRHTKVAKTFVSTPKYGKAKRSCFQFLQRSDADIDTKCHVRQVDLDHAFMEASVSSTIVDASKFKADRLDFTDLRTHLGMDCGLCLQERQPYYVPSLPAPTYLSQQPLPMHPNGGCTASDVRMFCLENTLVGRSFKGKAAYTQANKHCFPALLSNDKSGEGDDDGGGTQCQISEQSLHRIFVDSSRDHQDVGTDAHLKHAESVYAAAREELVRECDRCMGKRLSSYTPMLQVSLLHHHHHQHSNSGPGGAGNDNDVANAALLAKDVHHAAAFNEGAGIGLSHGGM